MPACEESQICSVMELAVIRADDEVERLVEENIRLAWFFAHEWAERLSFDDSLSLALEGLLNAARRHEPGSGDFGGFASAAIRNRMHHELRQRNAMKRGGGVAHVPLDSPIFAENPLTFSETIADERAPVSDETDPATQLAGWLAALKPRHRAIIEQRYGLAGPAQTLMEIAAAQHVTHQAVRAGEQLALRKLRQFAKCCKSCAG